MKAAGIIALSRKKVVQQKEYVELINTIFSVYYWYIGDWINKFLFKREMRQVDRQRRIVGTANR